MFSRNFNIIEKGKAWHNYMRLSNGFIRKTLFVLYAFTLITIYGCDKAEIINKSPVIMNDNSVVNELGLNNVSYKKENSIPYINKTIYGFRYQNMSDFKIIVTFELYVNGKLEKSISANNYGNEEIEEGILGLSFAQPLQIDNKEMIQWAIELDNNITFYTYEDLISELDTYSIDSNKEVFPKKNVSYPLVTFYANSNKNNITDAPAQNSSIEYDEFYINNYNFVFFLKCRIE